MKKILLIVLTLFVLLACTTKEKHSEGIIVTSPEVAETICYLGGMDKIIARTSYCDYPEEIKTIESVGDFSSINIERIISLKPSKVFIAEFEQKSFRSKLEPLGIEVISVHSSSLEDYYKNVITLGKELNASDKAQSLINEFDKTIKSFEMPIEKPKVYLEISNNLGTLTAHSFIGDLIARAGGRNIIDNTEKDFIIAKNENIVAANPDIIIIQSHVSKEDVMNRKGWSNITAVKKGNIYTEKDLDPDLVMRTIPRSIEALKILNKMFLTYKK